MANETGDNPHPDEIWLAVPWGLREGSENAILPERRARLWALVLESRYLPFRLERSGLGWLLLVPERSFHASLEELRLYEDKNRLWPPPIPLTTDLPENTLATLSVLLLLASFYNITLLDIKILGHNPVDWVSIGNAHSVKILSGEWWRLVTALTLHADWLHLLSNLALGGIFIVFLCREIGSGLAWTLLLLSGAMGNLANAFLHPPGHMSVGASTAVFGAVGILAAITMIRHRSSLQRKWPLPVAAGLALLALLGTEGERTDLGAHLFGFFFGLLFGLLTEYCMEKFGRPGRVLNTILAVASFTVVVSAWWIALISIGQR